jgi:hypothetical protein
VSHVLGDFHTTTTAPRREKSRYGAMRWAVAGCTAFWVVVGVGVAHALGS